MKIFIEEIKIGQIFTSSQLVKRTMGIEVLKKGKTFMNITSQKFTVNFEEMQH